MTAFLLDVNVLIALIDPAHVHHPIARRWFRQLDGVGWASCPITQLGVLRIVGHPSYPNSPGAPAVVAGVLRQFLALPGHTFWPDSVDVFGDEVMNPDQVLRSAQLTDTYLLALAIHNGGQLATLDRRLNSTAVRGGRDSLHQIG